MIHIIYKENDDKTSLMLNLKVLKHYEIFNIFIASLCRRSKSTALSSDTQHAMPPEFIGKWRTECSNTLFPLPTLCAGYSVELRKNMLSTIIFVSYILKLRYN